jgi:hypothetical protein
LPSYRAQLKGNASEPSTANELLNTHSSTHKKPGSHQSQEASHPRHLIQLQPIMFQWNSTAEAEINGKITVYG